MKAMVLAAGLGTRLRPLTDDRPKALVEVAGRTLLEITLSRLRGLGIRDAIINVHHFAEMIVEYLKANDNFGMNLRISREEVLLDTGGGLKKAASFFLANSQGGEEPFLVHNVDVISSIDLESMVRFHEEQKALATLAVQHRQTSRYLLFDEQLQLCGRRPEPGLRANPGTRPETRPRELAFSGIHVVSTRLFAKIFEEGVFSIIPVYLRLAAEGERILAFEDDKAYWCDLGRPENLKRAAKDLAAGAISGEIP